MKGRTNNRQLKKRLRFREKALEKYLSMFLYGFSSVQTLDHEGESFQRAQKISLSIDGFTSEQSLDPDSENFRLLRSLKWLVYDYIYYRLRLNPRWAKKRWFLDILGVDEVKIANGSVEIVGDIVWWAQGKDAVGEWWPADHKSYRTDVYRGMFRGDLSGGYWVLEPVIAKLKRAALLNRNAEYEIEFGQGSTYMKIRSKH